MRRSSSANSNGQRCAVGRRGTFINRRLFCRCEQHSHISTVARARSIACRLPVSREFNALPFPRPCDCSLGRCGFVPRAGNKSLACRAPASLLIAVSSDRFGRLDSRMSSRGISGSFEINRDWIAGRKGLLESFVEQLVEMLGSRLSVQWRIFAV